MLSPVQELMLYLQKQHIFTDREREIQNSITVLTVYRREYPLCGDDFMEFTVHGIRIRATFGFFALWAVILYLREYSALPFSPLPVFLLCLLHEAGHTAALLLTGQPPVSLTFYAGGISMSLRQPPERAGLFSEILVLSAGCAVNLLLAVLLSLTGSRLWAMTSLGLGLFNLLPHSMLDGGGILRALTVYCFPHADIDAAAGIIDVMTVTAMLILFIVKGMSLPGYFILLAMLFRGKRQTVGTGRI